MNEVSGNGTGLEVVQCKSERTTKHILAKKLSILRFIYHSDGAQSFLRS
jgi:hypothetical protein